MVILVLSRHCGDYWQQDSLRDEALCPLNSSVQPLDTESLGCHDITSNDFLRAHRNQALHEKHIAAYVQQPFGSRRPDGYVDVTVKR